MAEPNNPNSPNSQDKELEGIIERLKRGERVMIYDMSLAERFRLESQVKKKENLNLAVRRSKGVVEIKSGGYEVKVKENKVVVYDKKGRMLHTYENGCLARNITTLLFTIVKEVPEGRWVSLSLSRENRDVRKLQAWILTTITNFARPLKHNPLIC
jgi:ribosomal protein L14